VSADKSLLWVFKIRVPERIYTCAVLLAIMKIFICCSKRFYDRVPPIKIALERAGHSITLPNSYDDPTHEDRLRPDRAAHAAFKGEMLRLQAEKIMNNDAIVVLNYDKDGQRNYIGGATFLEVFKAFELQKRIYLVNPIPEGMLYDELIGMEPTVLHGDLSKIR
jgi:hypothetical protein